MKASRVFIMMGMAISMSLVACGGATDEFDQLATQDDELGELACATVSGTPYSGYLRNGRSTTPTACGTKEQFRSPGTTYDNGATCSDQYIAEVRNIYGRKLQVKDSWRIDVVPLSLSECDRAKTEIATYMRNASTGTWDVHVTKLRGVNFLGWGCAMLPESGYTMPPTLDGTEGYDLIRVAAKSTYTYIFGGGSIDVKVPVGIDIVYPPSPC